MTDGRSHSGEVQKTKKIRLAPTWERPVRSTERGGLKKILLIVEMAVYNFFSYVTYTKVHQSRGCLLF
jgi:hypothetical protein